MSGPHPNTNPNPNPNPNLIEGGVTSVSSADTLFFEHETYTEVMPVTIKRHSQYFERCLFVRMKNGIIEAHLVLQNDGMKDFGAVPLKDPQPRLG